MYKLDCFDDSLSKEETEVYLTHQQEDEDEPISSFLINEEQTKEKIILESKPFICLRGVVFYLLATPKIPGDFPTRLWEYVSEKEVGELVLEANGRMAHERSEGQIAKREVSDRRSETMKKIMLLNLIPLAVFLIQLFYMEVIADQANFKGVQMIPFCALMTFLMVDSIVVAILLAIDHREVNKIDMNILENVCEFTNQSADRRFGSSGIKIVLSVPPDPLAWRWEIDLQKVQAKKRGTVTMER